MGRCTVVKIFWLAAIALALNSVHAAAPALRDQVLLSGAWTGGTIPQYFGVSDTGPKTYERSVLVPSNWTGKIIQVEFLAVNHKADVYVNNVLIGSHTGGFAPFAFDITSKVTPNTTFTLKVVVTGTGALKGSSGYFLWPVGGWSSSLGISDDVFLRAYGKVHITDAFIKTSTASNTISVDYTVKNSDSVSRTVTISGDCAKPGSNSIEKTVSTSVTLAAGETKTVTASGSWTNPTLYWPDRPQLYHLTSSVTLSGSVIDSETRRFGFREIKIAGNQYTWNGVRINLYGDYQVFGDTWYVDSPTIHSKANFPGTVDRMLALNIRCMRWHHNPVPAYILDICDEKGMLVCDEGPNYGRDYLKGISTSDKAKYTSNFKSWCSAWIKQDRNRPSVYIFNATNEMTYASLGGFTGAECDSMGDAMKLADGTRPVGCDGDTAAAQITYNYHYPEGYNNEPSGSIYSWASKVKSSQPTGSGELLHAKSPDADVQTSVERNKWWIGIWTRGLRYTNWTDVRPACFWYADDDIDNSNAAVKQRALNLKNAYSPVALFDKSYDDLGIAPYVNGTTAGGTRPSISDGSTQNRTLVLYNDEFSGTSLTVECLVKIGSTTYATGTKNFTLALGEHVDIPASFQVPYVSANSTLDWILRVSKGGVLKFEESRRFTINSTGASGTSSNVVTITGGTSTTNQAPNVTLTSPSSGASYTAPASINLTASASDSDGTIAKVEFFANGALIGTDTSTAYTFTWTNVSAGSYSLTAKATDNDGATKTSAAVSITVVAPQTGQSVTGFTLVNADTDADISTMSNGMTIDLSKLPTRNLNVRANTSPAAVGSVKFGYDSEPNFHVENGGPYAFAGGTGNDYLPWTPAQGAHSITATPYTASNATGTAGTAKTVSFTVIDPPAITSAPVATGNFSAGQSVQFSAAASDPNGDALMYTWNFGDGSSGNGANASHTYSASGNFNATLTVSDGHGGSANAALAVSISNSFSAKINFQSAGATTPSGYVADTGAPFGNRGSGLSFGWNTDNSSTARERDSAASPNKLYDTLQHMQKAENPNAKWEIVVPNGSYRVRIVAGDPSYFDSVFRINAEGTTVVSATPSSVSRWADATKTVSVSDGRLTITNGSGASNNKLCFVEITADSGATARSLDDGEILFEPLSVKDFKCGLSFDRNGTDSVRLKVEAPNLPESLALKGLSVSVDIGGAMVAFTLDERGRAVTREGGCTLKYNPATKSRVVALTLKKGQWTGIWNDAGIDKTEKTLSVDWPIALVLGERVFGGSKHVTFECKSGKTASIN